MIDEKKVLEEFERALEEAIVEYNGQAVSQEALNIFIEDRVWDALVKYNRMELTTKEKFFEALYNNTSIDEYIKEITNLWNIDHKYMDSAIKELNKMVIQRDLRDAELYGNKKITQRSIKLENSWEDFTLTDEELYKLNPDRDFKIIEQRYVNRHIKLYKNMKKRYENVLNKEEALSKLVKKYDNIDKSIPYFSHKTGNIIRYVDVSTYNSMLYNVNLTRSAWNRAIYDAKVLGNHLWYLPAHPFACPMCAEYQGQVYADEKGLGYPLKEDAIRGGVGHPNCKHVWVSYWGKEQIQKEKYNSAEWEEKYETKQKIQSLDLKKSRLLADRRIYKELGQQDLVDKTTEQIKLIREKKKELEM